MAQDVTVDLGSFTICSHTDEDFCLTVSTTVSLSLPDSFASSPTAIELRDQVKAGSLWVTRAGSCRFDLSIYFEELGDDLRYTDMQDRRRETVMEAFQAFPAWDALGLDLRHEVNLFEGEPDSHAPLVYSIQHTRQHSGLFTPEGVACGHLSTVVSSFRFGSRVTYKVGKPSKTARIITLKAPPHELQRITGRPNQPSEFHDLAPDLQAEKLRHLTHNALNLLVGLKKKPSGIRFLKPPKSPSLLDLAPAVWNTDVVARTSLVPSISSALANLTSTQSPILRQKVEDLARKANPESPLEDVSGCLHQRMLVLLLRAAYAQRTKLRGPNAMRQPRTQVVELPQNDHVMGVDEPQISQSVGSVYETPLEHGIPPYAKEDDAEEVPASRFVRDYRPSTDGAFDDIDEDLGNYEYNDEQEYVPLEGMVYYSDHLHREDAQSYSQLQNHFDPDGMDNDDFVEDTIVYKTREYGSPCHNNLFAPDEMHHEGLGEDTEELQREYSDPDDMFDDDGLFGDGEVYLIEEEEESLQYRTVLDENHDVDLAADTSLDIASALHDVYDDEMYYIEEEPPTHTKAFEDNADAHWDADLAPEYAAFPKNADDHPFHVGDQDQVEHDFYEESDEDSTFLAPEGHTQDELHDQAMPSLSGVDVESRGNPYSGSIGHNYDYRTGGAYTPEYTDQFDHAEAEAEETVPYARLERYSHGWDQVPRDFSHPRAAHWTGSIDADQDLVGTHFSSEGALEFSVYGPSSPWYRSSERR
ncbi:hypothetical protein VMCG_07364 [Cytospora schulzeri]|uniref:Uncharacterized protein n=1 Tax=Cytospora schulzeri TaxID=448051 RepID=A0A423W300_9PEZI|nr:hypothetical protein VMCG_07364 [Valsa malicola]